MPLDQHIEGRHGERQLGVKIGCLVNSIFMGRGAAGQHESSVAKFDFWAKSKNLVSGIQRLTDSQMLEKATLRQNPRAGLAQIRLHRW